MRRFFICFLLCLMPLRLWAGVWMPMAENFAFTSPVQASMSHEGMDHKGMTCHEGMETSEPLKAGSLDLAAESTGDLVTDVAMQKGACHDGHCQFCGVCHQTASPVVWTFTVSVSQSHPLPLSVLRHDAGVASPPLIKPPIS